MDNFDMHFLNPVGVARVGYANFHVGKARQLAAVALACCLPLQAQVRNLPDTFVQKDVLWL